MAPVEKSKAAGQAIDQAERILRSIAPPKKRTVIPTRIVSSIESAEMAMRAAKSLAMQIAKMFNMPRATKPAEQRAQLQKFQKMVTDFRAKLTALARHKTGIPKIDQRQKAFVADTLRRLDGVTTALKRGNLAEANKRFSLIKDRADALQKVRAAQAALAKKHVSPTVILLADLALNHFVSGQIDRANLLLKACDKFSRYSGVMETTKIGKDLMYKNLEVLRKGGLETDEETALLMHKICLAYFLVDRSKKLEELTVKTNNVSLYCLYLSLEERVCDMLSEKYYESTFMEVMDEYIDTEPILAACSEICGLVVPPLEEVMEENRENWLKQQLLLP